MLISITPYNSFSSHLNQSSLRQTTPASLATRQGQIPTGDLLPSVTLPLGALSLGSVSSFPALSTPTHLDGLLACDSASLQDSVFLAGPQSYIL